MANATEIGGYMIEAAEAKFRSRARPRARRCAASGMIIGVVLKHDRRSRVVDACLKERLLVNGTGGKRVAPAAATESVARRCGRGTRDHRARAATRRRCRRDCRRTVTSSIAHETRLPRSRLADARLSFTDCSTLGGAAQGRTENRPRASASARQNSRDDFPEAVVAHAHHLRNRDGATRRPCDLSRARDIGIGERESVKDVARNLSRRVDLIMIRTFAHRTAVEMAHESTVPVINGLSDLLHPCQLLADLLTMQERYGERHAQTRGRVPRRRLQHGAELD